MYSLNLACGSQTIALSNGLLANGVWQHVAATFDHGTLKLLLNGVLDRTVTGAVVGATAVTLLIEVTRRAEGGFALGPIDLPEVFGLTQLALGVALLLSLYVRPEGFFGRSEIDEVTFRSRSSRSDS